MKKLLFFLFLMLMPLLHASEVHPYHVGSVEFNYNSKSKTFQVSVRLFMDDLEDGLKKKYGAPLRFGDERYKAGLNEALRRYCEEYIKLKADNKFVTIKYLGYEEDQEGVDIFLESEPVARPTKVEAAVSVLYNLYDDQMNIIHMVVDGERKSQKLTYPDRYLYQNF